MSSKYPKREYCVQYQESSLDFICRLLEEAGVFFFFEHRQGEHTLVLGDSGSACPELAGGSQIVYREKSGMSAGAEAFTVFTMRQQTQPSSVVLRDYNYLTPQADLTAQAGDQKGELKSYEHPGRYATPAEGKALAAVRLEEERARAALWSGRSTSRRLCPGYAFELDEHPEHELNGEYLLVSVRHRGDQPEALGGGSAQGKSGYQSRATCLRAEIPFRPERRTPRPSIAGVEPAVVVGPSSEEIWLDEHGRINVQFFWDREGKLDENSSCWIRVSQAMAGSGFGTLFIPRIGSEVTVGFEGGDPDRPVIAGSLYNGANAPPVDLPAQKTQSTIKTDSSPRSQGYGYNELKFEDAAGAEELYLHAQKDLSIEVGNDKTQTVGGSEKLAVAKDRDRSVGGNQTLVVQMNDDAQVQGNQTLGVAVSRSTSVGGSHAETVAGSQTVSVGGAQAVAVGLGSMETVGLGKVLAVGAIYAVNVGGAMNELVAGAKTEEVGGAKVELIGLKKSETVGGSRTLQVGGDLTETVDQKSTLEVTKELVTQVEGALSQSAREGYVLQAKQIEVAAEEEYRLEVGSASLTIKKGGEVMLSGTKIAVNGSTAVQLKAPQITEN